MTQIELKILDDRIGEGKQFPIPSYKTVGSAGIDLYAMVDEDTIIHPNETKLISTGISIYIKDPNLCATIIPRSGLGSKNGIVLGNLVGLIDSDYQGPLMCKTPKQTCSFCISSKYASPAYGINCCFCR